MESDSRKDAETLRADGPKSERPSWGEARLAHMLQLARELSLDPGGTMAEERLERECDVARTDVEKVMGDAAEMRERLAAKQREVDRLKVKLARAGRIYEHGYSAWHCAKVAEDHLRIACGCHAIVEQVRGQAEKCHELIQAELRKDDDHEE